MSKRTKAKGGRSRGTSAVNRVSERRDFLVKAGLGIAGATAGAATLTRPAEANAANAGAGAPAGNGAVHWDHDVDVVVAGAGNGGMSAALAAAKGGAKVLVIEISTQIGGNTLMSGGILHTAGQRNWEDYNKFSQGLHDQVLGKVFVETFWNDYIPWLEANGAYMSRPTPDTPGYYGDYHLGHGEPGQLRHKLYFDSLVKPFEAAGGKRIMKTRVVKLYADAEGRVTGLRAKTWANSPRDEQQHFINIRAKKTIMATGGWIMDGERKQKYLGQDGYFAQHYCGPFSSGEGIDICQAVGVGLSKSGWSSFSGGPAAVTATPLLAADMDGMLKMWAETPPEQWTKPYDRGRRTAPSGWIGPFPQFGHASRAILVNKLGVRFIDESSPVHARYPRLAQAIVRQPGGFVWVIADKKIYDAVPGAEESIQAIVDEGGVLGTHGNVIIANTLDEFATALHSAGVYRGAFLKTIEEYNAAVDKNAQESLPISHFSGNGSGGYAIKTPPFYAIPLRADPYLCFGGVRMNQFGQALDAQGVPIPNLYAPPPLGGGIQNEIYMGSIGSAGVFGYLAGKHAAAAIKSTKPA